MLKERLTKISVSSVCLSGYIKVAFLGSRTLVVMSHFTIKATVGDMFLSNTLVQFTM